MIQYGSGAAENKELFSAIKQGDMERVNAALDAGANVNSRQDFQSPLIVACKKGHESIANRLLDAGADVKVKDKDGNTALTRIIQHCHMSYMRINQHLIDLVKRLLEKGAEPNALTTTGVSPLIATCKRSSEDYIWEERSYGLGPNAIHIVKQLVDAGASVNHITNSGDTALIYAANANNTDIVRYLLQKDADPNITLDSGTSALFYAVTNDNVVMVRDLLIYRANPNQKQRDGRTPIILAARKNPNISRELIRRGADVNATDNNGHTAMSETNNPEIVNLLTNNGFVMQGFVQGPGITPKARGSRETRILSNEIVKELRETERRAAQELILRNNMIPFIPGTIASYLGGKRRKTRRNRKV